METVQHHASRCQTRRDEFGIQTDAKNVLRMGRHLGQAHEGRDVQRVARLPKDQPFTGYFQHWPKRPTVEELPQTDAETREI